MVKYIFNIVAFALCLILGTYVALDKLDLVVGIICFTVTAIITVFFNNQYEMDKPLYPRKKGDVQLINLLANPNYIDFHANSSFNQYHQEFIGFVFGYAHPTGRGQDEVKMFQEAGFKPVESLMLTKDTTGLETAGRVIASDRYVDNGIGYVYKKGIEDEQALLHYQANAPMVFGKQIFFLQEMIDKDEDRDEEKIATAMNMIREYRSRIENLESMDKALDVPAYITLRVYLKEPIGKLEYDSIVERVYLFEEYINNNFQIIEINTQ